MDLQHKPSMTSVVESHAHEEDLESDVMRAAVTAKPLGLSTFRATRSGLS